MLDARTINWLKEQDDWSFNVDEGYFSWEKDGKFFYYDDNGCWETSELIDVKKFTVKDGEAYYGNETIKELFDRVIFDEPELSLMELMKRSDHQAEEPREDMRKQEMTDVNEVVDGKEITNVTRLESADFIVEYTQDGVRSGMAVCSIDYLDCYDGDKTEDKAIVQDMVKDGTLELPDLFERPHYSEISPALLYFYDEVCKREFDDQYFLEFELEALPEKDKRFQGMSPQDILDEIEADMILYPSLAQYIEIDPYTDGDKDIEFYYTFRESIAENCNKNRDRKHLPVHNNIPGEVIFQEVEYALKKVENEVGEDLDFKEAITYCSGISPHDVLLSLKHEAESTRLRRGNTVLFGTMKYETQKDRKAAYKWAKSWMNKSAKRLNYEIYKKQKKDKSQGR